MKTLNVSTVSNITSTLEHQLVLQSFKPPQVASLEPIVEEVTLQGPIRIFLIPTSPVPTWTVGIIASLDFLRTLSCWSSAPRTYYRDLIDAYVACYIDTIPNTAHERDPNGLQLPKTVLCKRSSQL